MAKILLILLGLLCYFAPGIVGDPCPGKCPECTCSNKGSEVTVNCTNYPGIRVPSCLDQNTVSVIITSSNITRLVASDFASAPNLVYISITKNPKLTEIEPRTFSNLRKLKSLLLSKNKLKDITNETFLGLESIVSLNLSGNGIVQIGDHVFSHMTNFNQLDLSDNNLVSLHGGIFSGLSSLECLLLHHNKIVLFGVDTFQDMDALRILRLDHNELFAESFDPESFAPLVTLQHLDLSTNSFTDFPRLLLHFLHSLRFLNISANPISSIPTYAVRRQPYLEELHVSDMPFLHEVENGAFQVVPRLVYLSMNNNPFLTSFTYEMLSPTEKPHLGYLSLANNSITGFTKELFLSLPNLTYADISGNPLVCSCDAAWISDQLKQNSSLWIHAWFAGSQAVVCSSPANLQGVLLSRLTDVDLTCDAPRVLCRMGHVSTSDLSIELIVGVGLPMLTWVTPDNQQLVTSFVSNNTRQGNWTAQQETYSNRSVRASLTSTSGIEGQYQVTLTSAGGHLVLKMGEYDSDKGLSRGAVVAIVVGSIVVLVVIKAAMVTYNYQKKKLEEDKIHEVVDEDRRPLITPGPSVNSDHVTTPTTYGTSQVHA